MVGPMHPQSGHVVKLEDISALSQPHCRIKDPAKVERIINEFIAGGPERLQVVSDFDFTITKPRTEDGTLVPSSFGIFDSCKSLPAAFVKESRKLHDIYRPIEVDPKMPTEEKSKYMIEWWTKSGNILVGFPFNVNDIDEIASKYKHAVRDGSIEFFAKLNQLQVPVLVFSAGLGNCVMSMMKHAAIWHPNVKLISNFLQFTKDGLLNGFQEPVIHTFNKNETMLIGSEYYDLVHNRDHIILMGDTLADAGMADGVPSSSHTIKIGFLFNHVEENLETYMNTFDIVLIDDQTMDVPRALLTLIEAEQSERPAPEGVN